MFDDSCRGNDAAKMRGYLKDRLACQAYLYQIAAHINRGVRYTHSLAREYDAFEVTGGGKLPVGSYTVRLKE